MIQIAQTYSKATSKASFMLNRRLNPIQAKLKKLMQNSTFSLAADTSNDQNVEKLNPVTVIIF